MVTRKQPGQPVQKDSGQTDRRAPGPGPLAESPRMASREECMNHLRHHAEVGAELSSLLGIPERLYIGGDGFGLVSFSSDPAKDAQGIVDMLFFGDPFKMDAPDFALLLTHKGSSTFCILVDKSRKIIVYDSIFNLHARSGNWEYFTMYLKDAIQAAESLKSEGVSFNFVVRGEKDSVI